MPRKEAATTTTMALSVADLPHLGFLADPSFQTVAFEIVDHNAEPPVPTPTGNNDDRNNGTKKEFRQKYITANVTLIIE